MNNLLSNIDYFDYASIVRPQIEKGITNQLEKFTKYYCNDLAIDSKKLQTMLQNYLISGKLHRSVQVLYWAKCYGCEEEHRYINFAIAMEFLQAFLLMHDDVMDNDDLRRGSKSIHIQLADIVLEKYIAKSPPRSALQNRQIADTPVEHTPQENLVQYSKKIGESLAICLGDMLFSFSYELLLSNCPKCSVTEIALIYSKYISRVGSGQFDDVLFASGAEIDLLDANGNTKPEKKILAMYGKKTGAYTFSLPMSLGMLIANVNSLDSIEAELTKLDTLGTIMGTMFQIQDDIIGACNSKETLGKVMGSDFISKKPTYLAYLLFRLARQRGLHKELDSIWNTNIGKEEISKLQGYIKECQVLEILQEMLAEYKSQAYKIVDELQIVQPYSAYIYKFIDYLVARDK